MELITVRRNELEYTKYCKDCYFNTFYEKILENRYKQYYDLGNEIVNDKEGNYIATYNLSMASVMYHSYKRVKENLFNESCNLIKKKKSNK